MTHAKIYASITVVHLENELERFYQVSRDLDYDPSAMLAATAKMYDSLLIEQPEHIGRNLLSITARDASRWDEIEPVVLANLIAGVGWLNNVEVAIYDRRSAPGTEVEPQLREIGAVKSERGKLVYRTKATAA